MPVVIRGMGPVASIRPIQANRPKPAPEAVVKKMTEKAGCMSAAQRAVEPAQQRVELGSIERLGSARRIGGHLALGSAPRPRRQVPVHRLVAELGHQLAAFAR